MLSQLIAYYDEYEKELEVLHKKASPTAGLWGMGNHPKDDRCNDIFYENVEKWVEEFLESNPTQTDAETATEWILKLAQIHRQDHTYWFSYAIQIHAEKLIPLIGQQKALELQNWYDEAYPKVERLPAHAGIYKLLQRQSGHAGPKGFAWFRKK